MIHAVKIEVAAAAPGEPTPPTQAARLLALTAQITQEMARVEGLRGGSALAKQEQRAQQVEAKRGLPVRIVAVHRLTGERVDVVAAGLAAAQGAPWFRVWHHVCRNEEHQPCQPWELVGSSEGEDLRDGR